MTPPPELRRGKCLGFSAAVLVLVWLILEGGIALTYRVVRGAPLPRATWVQTITRIARSQAESPDTQGLPPGDTFDLFDSRTYVVHPFLGYFANLSGEPAKEPLLGLPRRDVTRSPDRFIVGILGGSFAGGVYVHAGRVLADRLRERTGREVSLVQLALAGYKQPQQLMLLAYLLSLGAEFDAVLNIDGFNEVVLGPSENAPKGVFPAYPRNWYYLTGQINDAEGLAKISRLADRREQRLRWARLFAKTRLTFSNLALVLWRAGDVLLARSFAAINQELAETTVKAKGGYEVTGPQADLAEDQMFAVLARVWRNGSLEMRSLCEGFGTGYYHFLQPNQYVEGSKPMQDDERAIAMSPRHPYAQSARKGYPYLIEYGKALPRAGVNFHDLTPIFAGNSAPLYKDDCCHLNDAGYRIVAERIAELMLEDGFGR
jgi:hypothetical protein